MLMAIQNGRTTGLVMSKRFRNSEGKRIRLANGKRMKAEDCCCDGFTVCPSFTYRSVDFSLPLTFENLEHPFPSNQDCEDEECDNIITSYADMRGDGTGGTPNSGCPNDTTPLIVGTDACMGFQTPCSGLAVDNEIFFLPGVGCFPSDPPYFAMGVSMYMYDPIGLNILKQVQYAKFFAPGVVPSLDVNYDIPFLSNETNLFTLGCKPI